MLRLEFMQVKSNDRALAPERDTEKTPRSIGAIANRVERNDCPMRRSSLSYQKIDEETVILDCEQGLVHELNPTASFVWDYCDGDSSIGSIVDHLTTAYNVDQDTALSDVRAIIAQFRDLNLLETHQK